MTAKPNKMEIYLAANQLREAVNAYRAQRDEAGAQRDVEAPAPIKKKSWPLPPQDQPTPIPGFPFNASPPKEAPDYGSMGRLHATRAAQAERRGKNAPMKSSGAPELRKKGGRL
jgi:hypothetical protein